MGPCLGGRENQRIIVLGRHGAHAAMGPCLGGRENAAAPAHDAGAAGGRNGALPWRQGEFGRRPWGLLGEPAAMGPCLGGRENVAGTSMNIFDPVAPQWGPALEAGRILRLRAARIPRTGRNGALPWRQGESVKLSRLWTWSSRPQWGPALEAGRISPEDAHHPRDAPAAMGPCLGGRENREVLAFERAVNVPQWGPALEAGRIRHRSPSRRGIACRNGALPWRQGEFLKPSAYSALVG